MDGETTNAEVVVKAADMNKERQEAIIEVCRDAISKFTLESEVASYIKKNVESMDTPTWHCVVGVSFGSYVAHTRDHFLHIKIKAPQMEAVKNFKLAPGSEWCNILIFKTS